MKEALSGQYDNYIYQYGNWCDYACASSRCSENRSHLAYLKTSSSLQTVLLGIQNATTTEFWWIGLNKINTTDFQWLDETSFENLSQIRTENGTGEDCVALQIHPTTYDYTWTALNCSYSNENVHFLCETDNSTNWTWLYVSIIIPTLLFIFFLVFMIVKFRKTKKTDQHDEAVTANAVDDDYDDTLYENEIHYVTGAQVNPSAYEEPIRSQVTYVNIANGQGSSDYQDIAHPNSPTIYDNLYEPVDGSYAN